MMEGDDSIAWAWFVALNKPRIRDAAKKAQHARGARNGGMWPIAACISTQRKVLLCPLVPSFVFMDNAGMPQRVRGMRNT
ncbi:hypothetical protein GGI23_006606, partial [Coemansia sp. RSA 2559]